MGDRTQDFCLQMGELAVPRAGRRVGRWPAWLPAPTATQPAQLGGSNPCCHLALKPAAAVHHGEGRDPNLSVPAPALQARAPALPVWCADGTPVRVAKERTASRHSVPHPMCAGGVSAHSRMVFPWWKRRGTASDQLPRLKLRVGFLVAMPPISSCASSAGTDHYHHDVPSITLPVPGGGAEWGHPDHLFSGQSYFGPKGWECEGEKVSWMGCLCQCLPCPQPVQRQALRARTGTSARHQGY